MNKKKLYWVLQIGGWAFYVFFQVFTRVLFSEKEDLKLAFFTLEGLLFFLSTHYSRFLIKKLNWTELPMFRVVPRVLLSVIIMSLGVYFIRLLLLIPLGIFQTQQVQDALEISQILGLSAIYSVILFIWMVLYFAYHYFINYNQALKQDAAIKEIELNNLKSQLNPHFIFNSLNSIRALVDENPKNSKMAITQLSNILRSSLVSDKKRLTTFSEELKIVKDYLGLEAMRYEERLKVKFDIHPSSGSFLIPPLMLQTLVENAIKHGISQLKEGGELSILSYITNSHLVIEIRNAGHYEELEKPKGTGLGIANTKRRLEMIFGKKAIFYIKNEDEGKVLTYLELPKMEEL
ncbi:MAG: histidine kinase [Cyclobacteriaceae bacterium]|nr:histidine kinase [Cyclobacteriaceae bacterium]